MSTETTHTTPASDADTDRPAGYPINRLYAILDTPEALEAALAALAAEPGGPHARALCCDAGRDRLDATGKHASLFGRLIRVPGLGVEAAHVQRYDEALRQGHYVVEVKTTDERERVAVANTLRAQGGHFINFYGWLTIEQLAP